MTMKRPSFVHLSIVIVILAALLLPGSATVQAAPAATITVTNLNDSGAGSLRQAVIDAASGDTINFSVTGTILLTSGQIPIDKNLTITGPGAGSLTVSGNNASRVFMIDSKTVAISGLTISKGRSHDSLGGGGIRNYFGTLTLNNCIVDDNASSGGGGILSSGTLSVNNCIISDNTSSDEGGGIFSTGTVTVSNSTLSGNTASTYGGGIFNTNNNNPPGLTVNGGAIFGNTALFGGGLYNKTDGTASVTNGAQVYQNSASDDGGGVYNLGALTVSDSTFSANMAAQDGGGVFNAAGGTLDVINSTLFGNSATNNGGGIFNTNATLNMSGGVLSGNSATTYNGGGLYNEKSGLVTVTNGAQVKQNLASDDGGGVYNGSGLTVSNGAQIEQNSAGDGGGVFNLGKLTASDSTISNNTASDDGGGVYNGAGGTLGATNSTLSGNTATILGGGIFNYNTGTVNVNGGVFSGNSAEFGGGLYNDSGGVATVTNSAQIKQNAASNDGGGVYNHGGLTVTDSTLSNNTAVQDGRVIFNAAGGALNVNGGALLSGNTATILGGGIFNDNTGTVHVNNGILDGNSALFGGGLYNNAGGTATATNGAQVKNNSADDDGGGAYNLGNLTVTNSTLSNNSSVQDGGGVFNAAAGALNVNGGAFSDNAATINGGGIFNDSNGGLSVSNNAQFAQNTADQGGGIYNNGGVVTVSDSDFSANTATNAVTGGGGGILSDGGVVTVNGSAFSTNAAYVGGGIYTLNNATLALTDSALSGNTAKFGGGLFNVNGGAATVSNSTFSGNTVEYYGGGIHNQSATLNLSNVTLSNNTTTDPPVGTGGGVYNEAGTLNYANTIIANSTTAGDECANVMGGVIGTNANNLVEDGSCSPSYSGDPKLLPLVGGVHVPQGDSPVIDMGEAITCAAVPVNGLDQRGEARDDLGCDIGAVEVKLSDTDTITKLVGGAATYTFGPTLVRIDVTAQGALSQLVVQHHSGNHPNATRMNGQWWAITPTGAGFAATLDLPHTVNPHANAKVCKHVAGSTWDCDRTGSSAARVLRDGIAAFSDWAVGDNVGATAVSLASFAASAAGDLVILTWATATELETMGFHLYRATDPDGPFTRITGELIPAQGDALSGATYEYQDAPGVGLFYYALEDVAVGGGATRHPALAVQAGAMQRIYLPVVER